MTHPTAFDDDDRGGAGRPTLVRPFVLAPEDENELSMALEQYKQQSGRLFPTCSEILEVLRGLNYAKRIWRPVGPLPAPAPGPDPAALEDSFRALGEDASTGHFCWFSRVETPSGT